MFRLHPDLESNFTEGPGGINYKTLNDQLKAFKLGVF